MPKNENDYNYEYDDINNNGNNSFGYEEESDDPKISQYYMQRRMQKNKMERKVRQGQMWLKRVQILIRLITILFLAYFGYFLLKLPQWYLNKNIFSSLNNSSLEILNNKIVPSSKILSALRRTEVPNVPIYRLETDEIKQNIMQLDPIDNVYIRRFWFPARLQIIVEEKTPIISISPSEKTAPVAFFAKDGKLIGRDYLPLPKPFKTVLVLSYGTKGDDYRNWTQEKIKLLENIAKAVKTNSNEDVQYIDCRSARDIYVKIKSVNLRLGAPDDTVFDRINRISSILPQVKTLDKKIKYVDLRWKDANYIKLE